MPNSDSQCKERRNVFFLKIQKSGSTTVQQLLLRFGMVRDLSFALFVEKWTYPSPTFSEFLLPAPNRSTGFDGQYNIICEHTVYNETELKRWMPGDTFYLANIRHPLTHVKSTINYYKLHTKLNISTSANFLAELLSDPQRHDKANSTRNIGAVLWPQSESQRQGDRRRTDSAYRQKVWTCADHGTYRRVSCSYEAPSLLVD